LLFNNRLDALVAGGFLVLVGLVLLLSAREWWLLLRRRKPAVLHETEPVWLPEYALRETGPNLRTVAGATALALGLARELSGETQYERVRAQALSEAAHTGNAPCERHIFDRATRERFQDGGVRRCC
jgi:hypothetical protein